MCFLICEKRQHPGQGGRGLAATSAGCVLLGDPASPGPPVALPRPTSEVTHVSSLFPLYWAEAPGAAGTQTQPQQKQEGAEVQGAGSDGEPSWPWPRASPAASAPPPQGARCMCVCVCVNPPHLELSLPEEGAGTSGWAVGPVLSPAGGK